MTIERYGHSENPKAYRAFGGLGLAVRQRHVLLLLFALIFGSAKHYNLMIDFMLSLRLLNGS